MRKLRQASHGQPAHRRASLPKQLPRGTDPVAAALREHRQRNTALGQRYASQMTQQRQISKADQLALAEVRAKLEAERREFQSEREATKQRHAAEVKEVKRSAEADRQEYIRALWTA